MRLIFLALPLILAGCTTAGDNATGPDGSTRVVPTGASLETSGFASIGISPPSAFPEDPPPMPTQLDTFARRTSLGTAEERAAAWADANGSEDFQKEFQRLREVIAREVPDNFIQERYIRENGVQGEFLFRRDGKETLARYTSDQRFVATTVDFDPQRLNALEQEWIARIEAGGPVSSISTNRIEGKVEIEAAWEEAEFRELARRKGWDISDPMLSFTFAEGQPPAFADPALEGLVRVFAREEKAVSIRLLALGQGRIGLDDGCFKLIDDKGKPGDTLVMFDRRSQLALDDEGYLAVRTGDEIYRIGEVGAWGGPNGVDEKNPDVRALRKACGDGPLLNVASPESRRLFALPYPLWVLDYAYTKDITYEAAWDRVIACIERQEERGRVGLEARNRCIDQYNGWDYTGDTLPPPPGQ